MGYSLLAVAADEYLQLIENVTGALPFDWGGMRAPCRRDAGVNAARAHDISWLHEPKPAGRRNRGQRVESAKDDPRGRLVEALDSCRRKWDRGFDPAWSSGESTNFQSRAEHGIAT